MLNELKAFVLCDTLQARKAESASSNTNGRAAEWASRARSEF